MRLLSCAVALAFLSLLSGWFVWIVRRRAGEIQSTQYQSWLALSAAAIRKPVALFLWMCGGVVCAASDCCGYRFPAYAYFLGQRAHSDSLRRMDYRAAVAGFSGHSRSRKTHASVGGENAQLTRQNRCSNRWTVITALGAATWNHSVVTTAQASRRLGMGDTERCRHSVHRHAFISDRSRHQCDAGCTVESTAIGSAGQSFRAPDLHPGIGDSQNYHYGRCNHCDRFGSDAFRSRAPVRYKYFGFGWNCRHRHRLRRATDSRKRASWNSDRADATATDR